MKSTSRTHSAGLVSREKKLEAAETIHVDMIDLRICAEEASQMYEIE